MARRGLLSVLGLRLFLCFLINVYALQASNLQKYTCPMHPNYIVDAPGNCPFCGMTLVPVTVQKAPPALPQKKDHSAHRPTLILTPERVARAGVRTQKIAAQDFGMEVRSYGLVAPNERARWVIDSRVAGWVETLAIRAVGDLVTQGQLLFTLNSPELLTAQQDYVIALKGGKLDVTFARNRLVSLGIDSSVIEDLEKTKRILTHVPFFASQSGVVSDLNVRVGAYIERGETLATIQDYGRVWILAKVAQKDLHLIEVDSSAQVTFPHLGGAARPARVEYLYPTVDPETRTGQVRLVLENPQGELRPGAYADVLFKTKLDKRLSAPSSALLRGASGTYVMRALGAGGFQPQRVVVGRESMGMSEILSGLSPDDAVVVGAQFLLDAESSLQESLMRSQATPGSGHVH